MMLLDSGVPECSTVLMEVGKSIKRNILIVVSSVFLFDQKKDRLFQFMC